MTSLPQLRAVSIRQTVGEAIRNALLDGKFRPGQALSEVALAAQMNVSRGPVREALLMLAQEGLVTHSQNYGFAVLEFTDVDCREVQEVRLPLEILALQLARERVKDWDIGTLSDLKRRIVTAYKSGSFLDCTQSDLQFHRLIWERSGNARLLTTLCSLLVPYFAYGTAFNLSRPDLTADLLDAQHQSYIGYLTGSSERSVEQCVAFHSGI